MLRRGEPAVVSDDEKLKRLYTSHLKKVDMMLQANPHFDLLDVHYRQVVENPTEQAERVSRFLGLKDCVPTMAAAVDDKLYRNRHPA